MAPPSHRPSQRTPGAATSGLLRARRANSAEAVLTDEATNPRHPSSPGSLRLRSGQPCCSASVCRLPRVRERFFIDMLRLARPPGAAQAPAKSAICCASEGEFGYLSALLLFCAVLPDKGAAAAASCKTPRLKRFVCSVAMALTSCWFFCLFFLLFYSSPCAFYPFRCFSNRRKQIKSVKLLTNQP